MGATQFELRYQEMIFDSTLSVSRHFSSEAHAFGRNSLQEALSLFAQEINLRFVSYVLIVLGWYIDGKLYSLV